MYNNTVAKETPSIQIPANTFQSFKNESIWTFFNWVIHIITDMTWMISQILQSHLSLLSKVSQSKSSLFTRSFVWGQNSSPGRFCFCVQIGNVNSLYWLTESCLALKCISCIATLLTIGNGAFLPTKCSQMFCKCHRTFISACRTIKWAKKSSRLALKEQCNVFKTSQKILSTT